MPGETTNLKEPLLSICLPTYNQPEQFDRLLKSLIPQVAPDIEIIVRDDSTNNDTEKVFEKHSHSFPMQYFHGEKKGLDVAVIYFLEKARGKFVWWFGNETFAPDGFTRVANILRSQSDVDFLYVNSAAKGGDVAIDFGPSRYFRDKNEVTEEIADLLGFISAVVFKRSDALLGNEDSKKFINSAWVCLYQTMCALANSKKPYYINEVCFLTEVAGPEQKLWYDRFQVFAVNFSKVVHEFDGRFDKKSLKLMLKKNFESVWKGILVHRAMDYESSFGSDSPKLKALFRFYWNFSGFWIALPFLVMPRFILRFFYKIYKRIFPVTKSRLGLN